ncbi:MAG TPA: glycosyltransferase family 39 protein [Vicinamibacteria bacterium]|nr:glycosyltransferase family 39 protein [Vicinamibacteria bacterium]
MTWNASRVRLAVILALGACLQAVLLWMELRPRPRAPWGDEIMYVDVASRWARGEPATLDLLWPPLYPRLLALALRVDPHLVALRLAQVACLFAAALIWRDVARRLTGSALASDVPAALLLLDPQVAAFAQFLWPEALHLALFAAALWLLMARASRPGWLVAAGVLLGVCLLAKSVLGPFLPVLLLPLLREAGVRRGLARAALVAAACAATVLPTMIANAPRGTFAVASGARFNLWVGLNDRSPRNLVGEIVGDEYRRWQQSAPTFAEREEILKRKTGDFVRERGVLAIAGAQLRRQYFRLFHHDSFFTDQLPGGAIVALGLGYPDPPRALSSALRAWSNAIWIATLMGVGLGLAALPRERTGWLAVLLAFVGYNLALFLLLHVKTRYRLPFLPVLDLLAGAGVAALAGEGRFGGVPQRAAGALVAALLLYLAFA